MYIIADIFEADTVYLIILFLSPAPSDFVITGLIDEARQLVVHGHFTVNGKKATAPAMELKAGDVVKVKEKSTNSPKFKEVKDMAITVPSWMSVDVEKLEGKVVSVPTREEIDTPVAEHLIVELYSK